MKALSAILLVLAVIALIGSIGAMMVLFSIGPAINTIVPAEAESQFGADLIQETKQQISIFVNLMWLWVITVLITSLATLYFAATDLMAKKPRR